MHPHNWRKKAQQTTSRPIILQQCWWMHFHKNADKLSHKAHVSHCSQNKNNIINQIN